jgi:hypothetical protein
MFRPAGMKLNSTALSRPTPPDIFHGTTSYTGRFFIMTPAILTATGCFAIVV